MIMLVLLMVLENIYLHDLHVFSISVFNADDDDDVAGDDDDDDNAGSGSSSESLLSNSWCHKVADDEGDNNDGVDDDERGALLTVWQCMDYDNVDADADVREACLYQNG